jgi:hypothetical protein
MDTNTLVAALDFAHGRLLNTLDVIEKGGQPLPQVLAWRPGPARAHIAWQAMHCAATHDKYVNVQLRGGKPRDEALVTAYGGGSTPTDANVPDLAAIRSTLEAHYKPFRDYLAGLSGEDFARKVPNGRTVGESILLLAWHDAHHQGQIHLTWNLYKQAHGIT